MAQRKAPPSGKTSSGRTSSGGGAARPGTPKVSPAKAGAGTRPPNRKPGKSIVNQKQTPWGLIWTTVAVVVFAAVVVVAVVVTHKSGSGSTSSTAGGQTVNAADPYRQPELAAAKQISGLTYRVEGQHNHVTGSITYDSSPPVGGNHNGFWADCTGTVYPKAIANENAVHMLEHGAVWITYNPTTLSAAELTKLKTYVSGVNMLALSPYPNLKTPISLQSWGYQLFVDSAGDPRIAQFIATLKLNKKTTPEYGASCSNPGFKQNPSTFGHPSNG
ncbi:MAG TPA: DUF3105 domain-containing protein [Jatrophihabitans sp.]|uniref:DUF3105 domain-containing protein n=1 Tax=Jatrophihabitans sp. TaxID=1932789 RepID=UPI002E008F80|nr:DUF3105 domain-containing protein [Jatrophihabitans sp.]